MPDQEKNSVNIAGIVLTMTAMVVSDLMAQEIQFILHAPMAWTKIILI